MVYIAGSDYYLPVAVDDQPLPPDRGKAEIEKLKNEVERRNKRVDIAVYIETRYGQQHADGLGCELSIEEARFDDPLGDLGRARARFDTPVLV